MCLIKMSSVSTTKFTPASAGHYTYTLSSLISVKQQLQISSTIPSSHMIVDLQRNTLKCIIHEPKQAVFCRAPLVSFCSSIENTDKCHLTHFKTWLQISYIRHECHYMETGSDYLTVLTDALKK